jgi:hypothetical protein
MRIAKIWKTTDGTVSTLSGLLLCLALQGGLARGASAQAENAAAQSSPPSGAWHSTSFASREITVLGSIQEVVPTHATGSPAGMHILIDSLRGSFDASLGSYLTAETKQSLSNGAQVQVTGIVQTANGKDYLLVRQLSVGGHQVTIRNSRGFLVRTSSPTGSGTNKSQSERNGGIQ